MEGGTTEDRVKNAAIMAGELKITWHDAIILVEPNNPKVNTQYDNIAEILQRYHE